MKFIGFIIWSTFSFVKFQFRNAEEYHEALVIQRTKTELKFPTVLTFDSGQFSQYRSLQRYHLTYLCPDEQNDALRIKNTVYKDSCFPSKMCKKAVEPTILQVDEVLKNDQGKEQIHWYHIGFTVSDYEFSSIVQTTKYVSFNENYRFMPMISVYLDNELQLTIAVQYRIIQVDLPEMLQNEASTYNHINIFRDKVQEFYEEQQSKLEEMLGENYDETVHVLNLDSLIPENHFIVEEWKKTARYKVHQILIWKENLKVWKFVQEMVRQIASTEISWTTVFTGIGKVLTIKDSKNQEHRLEWGSEENKIYIPELYWTAIKFTKYNKSIGMLIIMNNEPRPEDNNVERICESGLCEENPIWNLLEEYYGGKIDSQVYCCPINLTTMEKLESAFLLKQLTCTESLNSDITIQPIWNTCYN